MGCCQSKPDEKQSQNSSVTNNHHELEIVTNIIGKNERNTVDDIVTSGCLNETG